MTITITELLNDKTKKAKEKVETIGKWLLGASLLSSIVSRLRTMRY